MYVYWSILSALGYPILTDNVEYPRRRIFKICEKNLASQSYFLLFGILKNKRKCHAHLPCQEFHVSSIFIFIADSRVSNSWIIWNFLCCNKVLWYAVDDTIRYFAQRCLIIDISLIIHRFLTSLTVNHLPKDLKARKFNPALQINDMINHHR